MADGKAVCEKLYVDLLKHETWIWTAGSIEYVMGIDSKGEGAIEATEEVHRNMSQGEVANQFPDIVACFKWLRC